MEEKIVCVYKSIIPPTYVIKNALKNRILTELEMAVSVTLDGLVRSVMYVISILLDKTVKYSVTMKEEKRQLKIDVYAIINMQEYNVKKNA